MKQLTLHQQGLIAVFAAAILWSSSGLLIKLVTLTPMQISFFRCSVAAIAYAFFSFGLKRVFAVEASIFSMVEPVLTPFWAFIGYGEVPATHALIGGVIIIVVISVRTLQMGKALFGRKVS
jgi:drug/metabolite transporter (DMT)-like permease